MSGFETASAALAVIQLTKHTVTALVQLLREYKEAGSKLFEITGDFDCFQWRLKMWLETWHIDAKGQEAEDSHVKVLWGETGGRIMILQLASIDEDCRRFAKIMARLLGDENLSKSNLQRQFFEARILESSGNEKKPLEFLKGFTRDSKARLYREALQTANRSISTKAKADFIISKGETLKKLVEDLENKFRKLDDDSFKTFCYHHPDVHRSASQADIANSIQAETTLQKALDTRDASRAFYHWCLRAGTKGHLDAQGPKDPQNKNETSNYELKLDIDLLADRTTKSPKLNFHFFVVWQQDGQEQELMVEGPIPARRAQYFTKASPGTPIDFETACSTILVNDSKTFAVGQGQDPADSVVWFQSKYPVPNSVTIGKASRTRLRELLESIQEKSSGEAFEDFPSVERFDLAYKVVECGLMLLGTSWLSNIRSAQLLRLKNFARQQYWFVLEVTEGEPGSSALLDSVEPQTFMIGILLTEIAIAEPVVGVVPYDSESQGRTKLALKVIRSNGQGQKEEYAMRLGAAIRRVKNCMGQAYSEAVEFCLRQSSISRNPVWAQLRDNSDPGSREEAYKSLLKDFHQQVFLRIQKLSEMNRAGRGAI